MNWKLFCTSALFLLLLLPAKAQISSAIECAPAKPNGLVNDYVGVLSPEQKQSLEQKLDAFDRETSNQITVVITDTLCGVDASLYATAIGRKWGVGHGKFNNGVVVLIKPTGGPNQRKVFIATGYGLEGAIPDATAKLIVENEMIPSFKAGNLYEGITKGTQVLMSLAKGEYNYKDYDKKHKTGAGGILSFVFFILMIFLIAGLSFRRRVSQYAALNNMSFWTAFWMLSEASRTHSGNYGRFSGGSGFGSGGSGFGGGGGFGGFGGGGFGGGGAGGSW